MFNSTAKHHPSNELYNGEAESFEHAMELVIGACDYELRLFGNEHSDDKLAAASIRKYRDKAANACAEYLERKRKIDEEFVHWLRSHDDEEMTAFADALESGDYSGLAI